MPEALVKFGLKDALQDFCERISTGKELKLSFQFFGDNNRFHQPLETTVYRIAQELINNALKHANASEIMVQLMQDNNRLHLTVQDNGIGFDHQKVDIQKSSGLQNLKARAESFNGTLEISSKQGEGTEISVEFYIKS
jgi:signal transduction histidine kinase